MGNRFGKKNKNKKKEATAEAAQEQPNNEKAEENAADVSDKPQADTDPATGENGAEAPLATAEENKESDTTESKTDDCAKIESKDSKSESKESDSKTEEVVVHDEPKQEEEKVEEPKPSAPEPSEEAKDLPIEQHAAEASAEIGAVAEQSTEKVEASEPAAASAEEHAPPEEHVSPSLEQDDVAAAAEPQESITTTPEVPPQTEEVEPPMPPAPESLPPEEPSASVEPSEPVPEPVAELEPVKSELLSNDSSVISDPGVGNDSVISESVDTSVENTSSIQEVAQVNHVADDSPDAGGDAPQINGYIHDEEPTVNGEVNGEFEDKLCTTEFRWEHGGDRVFICGSFTGWKEQLPLENKDGVFMRAMDLNAGEYQYRYIVDDQWMVNKSQAFASGDDGTENNIITVKCAD